MTSSSGNNPSVSLQVLQRMAAVGSSLAGCADAEELFERLLSGMAEVLDADAWATAAWDVAGARWRSGPSVGEAAAAPLTDPAFLESSAIREAIGERREGLLVAHPGAELGEALAGLSSIIAAPVVSGERLAGMIALGSTRGQRRFGPADLAALTVAAGFAASVLEATEQFECFSRDLRGRIVEVTRELNHAMAELARVKSFNENIFESISMGIIVFDRSFSVVFRNRVADRCFPDDRNVLNALARTDITERHEGYKAIVRDVVGMGQECGFDGLHWAAGAERGDLVLDLAMSPLLSGREAIVGGVLTVEDVTRTAAMRRRLESSERLAAVGRLAAKVAHELNNPLDGILRYISMASRLCRDQQDARPVKYLEEAHHGLMRMVRIVSELLQFSRTTSADSDDGDIRTALTDAIKSLEGQAQRRGVALELRIADDVPPLESTSLYQVFTNLVKNAVEAVEGGAGRVTVEALVAAGAVEVRVADNGPGIPPAKLGTVFEPFYSTKEPGQGTGLGLAICKELVEKQAGSLVAWNRPEGGAEFVVRIPTQWVRDAGAEGGGSVEPGEA